MVELLVIGKKSLKANSTSIGQAERNFKMFKYRICILTIFLLMSIGGVCFADDRWFVVQEDKESIMYLDTTRAAMYGTEKDPYLECWKKSVFLNDNMTYIEHTYIRYENFNYKNAEVAFYKDNKHIRTVNLSKEGWKEIIPGSKQETAIINILAWSVNNTDKITLK
jgi:hypothetical protein